MHRTSLAPVLSATLHRVSCWIISSRRSSLRLLQDLDDPPSLRLGQWPRLHQADDVSDLGLAPLVVGHQLPGPADRLVVAAVAHGLLDPHHHGLVHLVGDDDALSKLPISSCLRVRSGSGLLAHDSSSSSEGTYSAPAAASCSMEAACAISPRAVPFFSPRAWASRDSARACSSAAAMARASSSPVERSRRMVRIRARSWRTCLIRLGLSSWLVANWKRRLNSSSFADSRRDSNSSSGSSRSCFASAITQPPAGR